MRTEHNEADRLFDAVEKGIYTEHAEGCGSHGTDPMGERLDCTCQVGPALTALYALAALAGGGADGDDSTKAEPTKAVAALGRLYNHNADPNRERAEADRITVLAGLGVASPAALSSESPPAQQNNIIGRLNDELDALRADAEPTPAPEEPSDAQAIVIAPGKTPTESAYYWFRVWKLERRHSRDLAEKLARGGAPASGDCERLDWLETQTNVGHKGHWVGDDLLALEIQTTTGFATLRAAIDAAMKSAGPASGDAQT
jgi:hypothetical protein